MDLSSFNPPDYALIDSDPLTFKTQLQAFMDALTAHQAEAGDLEAVNRELRTQLEQAHLQTQQAEQSAQQQGEAAAAAASRHAIAVAAYRQAMLHGDPSLPPELVAGDTIEDVDASLAKARSVVEFIRRKLRSPGGEGPAGQTAAAPLPPPRVPAGAPGRTLPDLSAMTAREKLIFGTSTPR